ncbi:MAG: hypothetical protein LBE84_07105 [Planctomycetota bacterium]|jgi:hypothetical protein|nr:hypothetical protein [Planctomycetota bacterium]
MTMTLSGKISRRPADWAFASGTVAALEPEILPRAFFEAVLKCQTRSEARTVLGKSPYRSLFPDDGAFDSISPILAVKTKEMKAEIFRLCPPNILENFFGIPDRFRTFRTLFGQAARQGGQQAAEVESLFSVFAVEPAFADELGNHRSRLFQNNMIQTASAVERSLFLDSAACSLMRIAALHAREKLARQYMLDRSLLSAWSSIFRSRWNGVPAETIRAWFIYDNSLSLAASILAAEQDPKAVISCRLSTVSAAILEGMEPARIKSDIDGAAADVLRDTVLACRQVSFGSERILSYLVAIESELVNLELCLGAVSNGIDRDITLSRLRREYA